MKLREARFKKRYNQWDVSLKTGIPQSKVSLIERGYVNPNEDEKKRLARALDCQIEEMFPVVEETIEKLI